MDFSYLLELAKANDKSNKSEAAVSKFSTKVAGAKKVNKSTPNVSAIKALLDKKDEDKAKASEEFKKKRANLLALRAQDRKANQRVSAMINRTKGASKAVLDDAKDITTARGEEQCDEDDYGYESAMSQQIFSKLADQYANMPEDDKLKFVKTTKKATISDIKSRVINNLKKEEEESMEPRKKKRRGKYADDGFINDGDAFDDFDEPPSKGSDAKKSSVSTSQETVKINYTNYKSDRYNNFKYDEKEKKHKHEDRDKDRDRDRDKKEEKSKKKDKKSKSSAAPPPMSFLELMKVAQQKQKTPEVKPPTVEKIIKEKEKKKEIDRPLTAKEKEELEEERARKLRRLGKLQKEENDKAKKNGEVDKGKKNEEKSKGKSEGSSKLQQALEKPKPEPKAVDRTKYFAVPGAPPPRQQPPKKEERPVPPPRTPPVKAKPPPPREPPREQIMKEKKPVKSRDFPPKDLKPAKPRNVPPKPTSRPFPPPDVRRPQHAPAPRRGRIESDSEEEYDSEMDDFIDDGEEELDYSSEIKRMFGYDKSKYADEDDDCDDMEVSYSQVQKEERISAQLGLKEDLEDIQREEDEKKRKMMRMKQLKNKGRR